VGAFPHIVDESGDVWATYGVRTQPAFVFINDDGTSETHIGALGEAGLTERINALS